MKITSIEPIVCHAYRTNWVFVRVVTDDGLEGVGEATLEYRELTVMEACRELNRTLRGRNASDIEAIWHDSYRDTYFRGGPVFMSALSAVEMALWDIQGKALGVPVHRLFGGKVRDAVPCYANGWFAPAKTPEEFADKAEAAANFGWRGIKWDPFGSSYRQLDRASFHQALECVEAVHARVGHRLELLIEGHGRFDIPTAIRIANELQRFDIHWFEEPIPPDNLAALAEVKRRVRVPIAAGERLYSRWEYRAFFESLAADFIQPDVSHVGGMMELKKIAATAETHHLAVCPHNPSGPVANAATLQLAACIPNFHFLETMSSDVPWRRDISTESVSLVDGMMTIPDRPGLGIELNWEEIAKHPYEPRELRHYQGDLTNIRPATATGYFQ